MLREGGAIQSVSNAGSFDAGPPIWNANCYVQR